MTRMEEYNALLNRLEATPEKLESAVTEAVNRSNALQKKRRVLTSFAGSLAACFAVFVMLVNVSVPFARACGSVPLLSALAKVVSWSPSLTAAVENDYVQPMNLVQTQNGIVARVEYLIVDRKQVDVFFSVDSAEYDRLDITHPKLGMPDGEHGWNSLLSTYGVENGELIDFQLNFVDRDVPEALTMTFGVYDRGEVQSAPAESSVLDDYGDELLSEVEKENHEILAEFTFELTFDPNFTAQGEVISVNETFVLDGQTVTLMEAEIYPTHLRLNLDYDPNNTAWLTDLNFYLENEHGERFEGVVNGISGVGSADSPAASSVWLDSPFFSQGEHLTLHITGAAWIDKERERIKVDLVNGVIDDPPQGVAVDFTERRDGGWLVSFSAEKRWGKDTNYQVWGSSFYDADGSAYDIDQRSMTTVPMFFGTLSGDELAAHEERERQVIEAGLYFETFGLKGYTEDEVWLEPRWTSITDSTADVVIR